MLKTGLGLTPLLAVFIYLNVHSQSKGLVIGIDRYLSAGNIVGCKNDALLLKDLMTSEYGFSEEDITVLLDSMASKEHIVEALWELVHSTQPEDKVFISFSGHGSQARDGNGDETDGQDEALVPYDAYYDKATGSLKNLILDDELHEIFDHLSNRRVVVVFDCCHSGTLSRSMAQKENARFLLNPELAKAPEVLIDDKKDIISDDIIDHSPTLTETGYIVYFYAAQPHQWAYPLRFEDGYYGILSASFNQAFRYSMRLTDAEREIRQFSDRVFSNNEEGINQDPYCEAPYVLKDKGLFEPLRLPQTHIVNEQVENEATDYQLSVGTYRGRKEYFFKDEENAEVIEFVINTNRKGYLYILTQDRTTGDWNQILPAIGQSPRLIQPGLTVFPGKLADYEIVAQAPAGADRLLFLILKENDMLEKAVNQIGNLNTSENIREALGSNKIMSGKNWQAYTLEIITTQKE